MDLCRGDDNLCMHMQARFTRFSMFRPRPNESQLSTGQNGLQDASPGEKCMACRTRRGTAARLSLKHGSGRRRAFGLTCGGLWWPGKGVCEGAPDTRFAGAAPKPGSVEEQSENEESAAGMSFCVFFCSRAVLVVECWKFLERFPTFGGHRAAHL